MIVGGIPVQLGSLGTFWTVLGLRVPNSKSLRPIVYRPLFRFIFSKSVHFSKTFWFLTASKQALRSENFYGRMLCLVDDCAIGYGDGVLQWLNLDLTNCLVQECNLNGNDSDSHSPAVTS
jgi:hypothetical protein